MNSELMEYRGDRSSTVALVLDGQSMDKMMAMADVMSRGVATVPRHLQKNSADCLAVIMQAMQWKMNPFAVAQKTHLVNGVLGYEAQLVNSVINALAPTKDRLNYEWFGDWDKVLGKFKEIESKKKIDEDTGKPLTYRVPDWKITDEAGLGVKVWATIKGEDNPRVLELRLIQCRVRNSPLWADDPRQQIAYLAVKRWSRLHCPDVIMGVYTPDELQEVNQEHIPPAPAGRQEIEMYSDERFKKNLLTWKTKIDAGKSSPEHIISMISSKAMLTKEQKDAIYALAPKTEETVNTETGEVESA